MKPARQRRALALALDFSAGSARARAWRSSRAALLLIAAASSCADPAPDGASATVAAAPAIARGADYRASRASYEVPDVELIDQRAERVSLRALASEPRPLLLSFIFTSCGSICPTLTATLAQAGRQLLGGEPGLRRISISIDPENDTPERLEAYARRFEAEPDWLFLTGTAPDIVRVLQAFDAYRGDKLAHAPLTFVRRHPAAAWLRLDGFTGAAGLVAEYRALAGEP